MHKESRRFGDKQMLISTSIENSIELMQSMVNEEAVASEDIGVDESNSPHYFGNKELFEHTNKRQKDQNLHRYQQESSIENKEQALRRTKLNPTRVRGMSYQRQ